MAFFLLILFCWIHPIRGELWKKCYCVGQCASLQLINFLLWKSHFRKEKCPNINNVCYGNPQPEVNIAAWILRQSTALPTQLATINYVSYGQPTKLWESNVFTCVCPSVHVGSPCDQYPWCNGPQCAAPRPIRHETHWLQSSDPRQWHLVAITVDLSNLVHLISTEIWWPKHVQLASGRHESYRNAFLLHKNFKCTWLNTLKFLSDKIKLSR